MSLQYVIISKKEIKIEGYDNMSDLARALSKHLNLPIINPERKYWLIRTNGGKYYSEFISNNFVAINYNEIDYEIIGTALSKSSQENKDAYLREKIEFLYPDEKRPGLVLGYINKFIDDIKEGDIILIPSKDSNKLAFGYVADNTVYYEPPKNIDQRISDAEPIGQEVCRYIKRRKVDWIKSIEKDNLDLKLFKAICSHNTISDVSDYGDVIDRCIDDCFIKNDELHLRFDITTDNSIASSTYSLLYTSIDDLINDFNNYSDTNIVSNHDIIIKTQAESPGFIELISSLHISQGLPATLIVGAILVFVFGGKFKFFGLSFESDGLPSFLIKMTQWIKMIKSNNLDSVKKLEKSVQILQDNRSLKKKEKRK